MSSTEDNTAVGEHKKQGKKPDYSSFNSSIKKICKSTSGGVSISEPCLGILNNAIKFLVVSMSERAKIFATSQKTNHKKLRGTGGKTITTGTIISTLTLLYNPHKNEKAKEAIKVAEDAPKTYHDNKDSKSQTKRTSRDDLAGSNMSIPKVEALMRETNYGMRVTQESPVLLAAFVQYVVSEWIKSASEIAEKSKKKTVTPKFLGMALEHSDDLKNFMSCGSRVRVRVAGGGKIIPKKKTSRDLEEEKESV